MSITPNARRRQAFLFGRQTALRSINNAIDQLEAQLQSIRFEHAAIIERLTKEAVRAGPTGVVAQKALILIVDHFAREEQFVFPPLGLLDEIAEGKLPDDATKQLAIKMAERTKASKDRLHEDHVQIDSLMNELRESATKVREVDLVAFASSVAAHTSARRR